MSVSLAVIEDIIDACGIAEVIEDLLPAGARARQLSVRTLLAGLHLTLADGRPAHLTGNNPRSPGTQQRAAAV